jgi:hypothetical protein
MNDLAFGYVEGVFTYLIGGIKAKTIAAIGTIAQGTTIVQYLFAPTIHHDLGGVPKMIIGSATNTIGEFSCVAMPLSSLKVFGCILSKTNAEGGLKHRLDLTNDLLHNTCWLNLATLYVGTLLPNFFILYFGQKPPISDITDEDVKVAFAYLGLGYKTWITLTEEAINTSCMIKTVLENAMAKDGYNQTNFVKEYFNKDWTGKDIQLATNGPTNLIT